MEQTERKWKKADIKEKLMRRSQRKMVEREFESLQGGNVGSASKKDAELSLNAQFLKLSGCLLFETRKTVWKCKVWKKIKV